MPKTTFGEIMEAIKRERARQDDEYGPQTLEGFLLILENEIEEAKRGWAINAHGRNSTRSEILQVAAVAVACLEEHGLES